MPGEAVRREDLPATHVLRRAVELRSVWQRERRTLLACAWCFEDRSVHITGRRLHGGELAEFGLGVHELLPFSGVLLGESQPRGDGGISEQHLGTSRDVFC
jgi:hypothetical protein